MVRWMRPNPENLKAAGALNGIVGGGGMDTVAVRATCVRLGWIDRMVLRSASGGDEAARSALAATAGSWVVGVVDPAVSGVGGKPGGKRNGTGRVVVNPWLACGVCDRCRAGLGGQCARAKLLGTPDTPGGLSGKVMLPSTALHAIPDAMDDEVAVFAPLVGDVAHMLQQVAIRDRNFVTILGDSPLALIAGQVLARHNKAVRVLGDDAEALSVGDRWGIKHRLASEAGLRQDQDVVVLCDVSPAMVERAIGMVRPRGELVLKATEVGGGAGGGWPDGWPDALAEEIVRMELRITGSWMGSPCIGLAMLERGEVDVLPLISRRIDPATAVALLSEPPASDGGPPESWARLDRMVVRFKRG